MNRYWSTLSMAGLAAATAWSPSSRAESDRGHAGQVATVEQFSTELRVLQKQVQDHGEVWFKSRGWPSVSRDNVEPRKVCTIQTHYIVQSQAPVKPMPLESTCQVSIDKIKLSTIKVRPYCRDRHCLAPNQATLVEWESVKKFPCTVNEGDNCSTWKDSTTTSIRFNSRAAATRAAKAIRTMAAACGAPEDRSTR